MTTLLFLINSHPQGPFVPLLGIYEAFQPTALVLCAQAAINKVALPVSIDLTSARPIHAPTLFAAA